MKHYQEHCEGKRNHFQIHRDEKVQKQKEYNKKNRDKVNACQRKYEWKHHDEKLERQQEYNNKHRYEVNACQKLYDYENKKKKKARKYAAAASAIKQNHHREW